MSDYLQQWFQRKLAEKHAYLREPATVKHTFHVHLGPHSIFGEVTLAAAPAEMFSFASQIDWPGHHNDDLVLDGILDVLFSYRHEPILGAAFNLAAIGWHSVDSAPMGYYFAAKEATKRIVRSGEGHDNIAFSLPNGRGQ